MSFAEAVMPRRIALFRGITQRAGRVPRRWRIGTAAVLAAAVVGVGVGDGILSAQASGNTATQADRAAATAAAKTEMAQILTYNYKTINADLARAVADTTGEFNGQLSVMAGEIAPLATQQQTVTKAAVPVAAAVGSSANQVTVLVFADQSTTNKQQPKAQVSDDQLRVTMQKVKGRWLVEQFKAL